MTVVWALTWLGQSAALAALTAACVRLPGMRTSAAARHAAWASALILCAGLLAWPLLPAASTGVASPQASVAAAELAAPSIPRVVLPAPLVRLSWWMGWVWAFGTVAGLGLAARDAVRIVRLKRRTVTLTADEQARLAPGLAAWPSSRAPRLAWCAELDTPAVLGFTRPVIALPRAQASFLSGPQARLVVLHELAHIRRGDDWWALAGRVILAVAWVNPAVHWVLHELSIAREMACDEWVVTQTAAPVAYAACLADVAALRTQARRLRLAAGVTGRPGTLRRRVVGVLALKDRTPARAAAVLAWVAPVAVCAVAAGLLKVPPVFVAADSVGQEWRVPTQVGPGERSDRVHGGRPATATLAAVRQGLDPRDRPVRRPPADRTIPAVPAAALESAPSSEVEAGAETVTSSEPGVPVGAEPLASSPLDLAAAPVLISRADTSSPPALQADGVRWWRGAVAMGKATSGAAATAGRATASLFARMGTYAPQAFVR